jgi:RNA polymerase sigma-70 factor (ECF subfamily)
MILGLISQILGGAESRTPPGGVRFAPDRIEAVRRRDQQALGELFELYFDRMYGLAYRLLGDAPAAEDVMQEVFLKVHRAADQLDPTRDPGPWLTTVTHNACREHWRRGSRKLEREGRSLDDDTQLSERVAGDAPGPENGVLQGEQERLLAEALRKLSHKLREVVLLHDYQGMSHEEIAELTGTRSSAVRKRYSRALGQLRGLLEGVI